MASRFLKRAWQCRLFVLLAFTYAYFYQGGDPNQGTRLFLTRAIVERRAPDITPYHAKTIDKSEYQDRFYSDKAPAVSLLATVPLAVMDGVDRVTGIDPDTRAVERVRLHLLVMLLAGAAGVAASVYLRRCLRIFGASDVAADLLTVGYALGTLVFPFSTVLFGHQLAAALLAASFYYALEARGDTTPEGGFTPGRLALIGALWGTSIVTEYPTALLVACQGLYVLAVMPGTRLVTTRRVFGWTAAGAAAPLVIHSAFLYWAFGSPFSLPYAHMAEPIFLAHVSTGILGVNLPSVVGVFGTFFSRYRGLFYYCPFLVLVFVGFRSWIASGERRAELWLCAAQVISYSFFCTGYYAWDGGGSTGPRHIIPALLFFVLPMAYFARSKRALAWVVVAVVPSVAIMLACTAVRIEVPEGDPWRHNPLYQIVVAALLRGEVAVNRADVYSVDPRGDASYNLGMLLGLPPMLSLVPLAIAWLGAYVPAVVEQQRHRQRRRFA